MSSHFCACTWSSIHKALFNPLYFIPHDPETMYLKFVSWFTWISEWHLTVLCGVLYLYKPWMPEADIRSRNLWITSTKHVSCYLLVWNISYTTRLAVKKLISDNLNITMHVIASELPGHCDIISNPFWRQQNVNRVSETWGHLKIIVLSAFIEFVIYMSYKKKIIYVLSLRNVDALTRMLFWYLFW